MKRPTFLSDEPHGIFATRHPARPNAIGLTIVTLLSREGTALTVGGVDARVRGHVSNMRPISGFSTDDEELVAQCEVQNKMRMGWYYDTLPTAPTARCTKLAASKGKPTCGPWWGPDFHGDGRRDIGLDVHDPEDVIPVQIGEDKDLNKAYGVVIRMRVPIARACEMFPLKQDLITADREAVGMRRVLGRIRQAFASPALTSGGRGGRGRKDPAIFPEVDIYLCYFRDRSLNMTDHGIPMGEPGTTSYYEVPPFRSQIKTGIFDSQMRELTREAGVEDALMYPRLRVWWATNNHILSDGPNKSWCPKVPWIPFEVDDWPWEWIGFGLPRDIKPMQDCGRKILRSVAVSTEGRRQPALGYDDQTVSKTLVHDFRPPPARPVHRSEYVDGCRAETLLPHDSTRSSPSLCARRQTPPVDGLPTRHAGDCGLGPLEADARLGFD